jgi:hypothetical protein
MSSKQSRKVRNSRREYSDEFKREAVQIVVGY